MTDRRQAVVDACASVTRSGVLSPSGHGNFSSRDDGERMLLTGAGLSKAPGPDDLALVRFDGEVEQGDLLPSVAEIVGMHAAVYRCRSEVGAVVHTHSPGVTAFALAHEPLPCRYEALLRHGQAGPVPVVAWAPRGSPVLVDGITEALDAHPETSALLLANHGVLAFSSTPERAAALIVVLEEAARAELAASASLGGAKELPPGALDDVRSSMRG
ncbi:MAG TPA: class II aldolase/adducin family protein [Acidimicrobiales bacterium]|nr:class II aldolase/adducin family protein [Acidimicrobiales bacterium]